MVVMMAQVTQRVLRSPLTTKATQCSNAKRLVMSAGLLRLPYYICIPFYDYFSRANLSASKLLH
jgi:hypothetical protein